MRFDFLATGWLARLSLLCCAFLIAACRPGVAPKNAASISESHTPLSRGVRYLLEQQSADGAWRSEVYGHFRGGDALTPLIVVSLQRSPRTPKTDEAIRKGRAWLMTASTPVGSIDPAFSLHYPVYTAALSIQALHEDSVEETAARLAWSRLLTSWQMTEGTGWHKPDWQYGGWGYSGIVPQKPDRGPIPEALDANLSATAYALEAMRFIGKPDTDLLWSKARTFVERCQNFAERASEADDGGFFFVPNDPFRNKAGTMRDAQGKVRYRSYGSATVDGLRCLIALDVPKTHPRFVAATRWLQTHQKECPGGHPGPYAEDRESDRDGPFFYYTAALTRVGATTIPDYREELMRRQREDGSWSNECNQVREDDPLLATALAIYALSVEQHGEVGE